jgi:hypothetical protein
LHKTIYTGSRSEKPGRLRPGHPLLPTRRPRSARRCRSSTRPSVLEGIRDQRGGRKVSVPRVRLQIWDNYGAASCPFGPAGGGHHQALPSIAPAAERHRPSIHAASITPRIYVRRMAVTNGPRTQIEEFVAIQTPQPSRFLSSCTLRPAPTRMCDSSSLSSVRSSQPAIRRPSYTRRTQS